MEFPHTDQQIFKKEYSTWDLVFFCRFFIFWIAKLLPKDVQAVIWAQVFKWLGHMIIVINCHGKHGTKGIPTCFDYAYY